MTDKSYVYDNAWKANQSGVFNLIKKDVFLVLCQKHMIIVYDNVIVG